MTNIRIYQCSPSEWYVGVGKGHYANPLSKQAALQWAQSLARQMEESLVEVYDLGGRLMESIAVPTSRPG